MPRSSAPVLWSVHSLCSQKRHDREPRNRFYQYLYYSGTSGNDLAQLLNEKNHCDVCCPVWLRTRKTYLCERLRPVTSDESMNRCDFTLTTVAPLVGTTQQGTAQFYFGPRSENCDLQISTDGIEREAGEQVGDFTIYRLKLR